MIQLSVLSGFLGAIASCLAKFALDAESPLKTVIVDRYLCSNTSCTILEWTLRLACLGIMIATNALMMGYFISGMEESGSVAGTGLSTAANFLLSALFGILLWSEEISFQWFVGFVMVLCGVFVLSGVKSVEPQETEEKKNK